VCLALVALHAHPRYALLIAANRDEFHARAAEPARWWPEGILAGTDSVGGGTWFGVTRAGRWSLVTNYREGVPRDPAAPSRGELVTIALNDATPPLVCAGRLAVDGWRYHGFNLLLGDATGGAYTSNRASGAIALDPGIHGLSNHLLETPWPKLLLAKARLAKVASNGADPVEAAFELLADRERAPASSLPSTGVSPEWERLLSSAFIVHAEYGTRCSTVFTIDHQGRARFAERSFDREGTTNGEVVYEFEVTPVR
jgi:uncharacterized protein with NRDE domain